ncbi:hypothetical protein Droror1_Dr00017333, partial [Drosera rotundifolia]
MQKGSFRVSSGLGLPFEKSVTIAIRALDPRISHYSCAMLKKAIVSSFFTRIALLANTVNDHSDVLECVLGRLDRLG